MTTAATVSTAGSAAAAQQHEERIGDDFIMTKEIGKGSFAVVMKGYKLRPHRVTVAIKVVTRSKLTPKLLENLEGEIAILRAISHPHIVELSDCIKTDTHIHLVMAFCAWGDLSMYIKSGGQLPGRPEDPIYNSKDLSASILPSAAAASSAALSTPEGSVAALRELWDEVRQFEHPKDGGLNDFVVRSFLYQLSDALQFMRGKNIVHRDIKPQNLLLQPADAAFLSTGHPRGIPQIKVADFGFARHLPATSLAETLCGSPLYMAPEILRFEAYDAKADLWSVGAVAFEMSVGKPPFRAANHVELLRKIERGEDKIRFPDERSEGSLARENARRQEEGLPPAHKPHPVAEDIKALIRSLLKANSVQRARFEDLFASPVVKSGSGEMLRARLGYSGSTGSIASRSGSGSVPLQQQIARKSVPPVSPLDIADPSQSASTATQTAGPSSDPQASKQQTPSAQPKVQSPRSPVAREFPTSPSLARKASLKSASNTASPSAPAQETAAPAANTTAAQGANKWAFRPKYIVGESASHQRSTSETETARSPSAPATAATVEGSSAASRSNGAGTPSSGTAPSIPLGAFDRRSSGSIHATLPRRSKVRQPSLEGGDVPGSNSSSSAAAAAAARRAATLAAGDDPSSLEDNTVATPVSSAGVFPPGPAVRVATADALPEPPGSRPRSNEGSLLDGEYAIVEKRNVEVNALADELAASPTQRFSPTALNRRPSRLSKYGSSGSLGRTSGLAALGLAPITAKEASDFSNVPYYSNTPPLTSETSTSSPGSRSRPWPIPSAPFALPPGQRPPSFTRRASLSSSGSPSPRLLNQSLPQSAASGVTRSGPGGPSAQRSSAQGTTGALAPAGSTSPSMRQVALSGGSGSGSGSPTTGGGASPSGQVSGSVSPTPSPYRAPAGTWTGYAGPPVGSAPSSALSRAISMASVRLFGVPSGMTLRNAAALVRSRSFRRLSGAYGSLGSADATVGGVADAAEIRLLNQLEDLGQKSFVLSEFADSRLAAHFAAGPHQMGGSSSFSSQYDGSSAIVGSLGRAEGAAMRHHPQRQGSYSSQSGHWNSGSGMGAPNDSSPPSAAAETAAAEALVLYAKSMGFLQRGIDITRAFLDARAQNGWQGGASPEINETVQWLRARFNESFEKANFAKARCSDIPPSAQFIDKLIFDKALEMARAAAVDELENNREGADWDAGRCLLAYETASSMLLAVLDPGEEGMTLSQNSIATVEKFSRSISKRLKALQDRLEPPRMAPSSLS